MMSVELGDLESQSRSYEPASRRDTTEQESRHFIVCFLLPFKTCFDMFLSRTEIGMCFVVAFCFLLIFLWIEPEY